MNMMLAENQQISEYTNYIMYGALGLFALFLILGMFWGLVRGRNKTGLRILTILVALPLALLLTPLFSKMFISIIKGTTFLPFTEGLSVWEWFKNMIINATSENLFISYESEAEGILTVVSNMILFLILFFIMKGISWIIYAIVASRVVPKKNESPLPVSKHRFTGLLLGIVQGFVFFTFLMIPVTGLMSTLSDASNHSPSMASFATEEGRNAHGSELMTYYNMIDDANESVQTSPFGYITKYTGIQAIGGLGSDYLLSFNADSKSFNLRRDISSMVHVFKDVVAIEAEFDVDFLNLSDEDKEKLSYKNITKKIGDWPIANYNSVKDTIGRLFDVSFLRMAADGLTPIIELFNLEDTISISDDEEVNKKLVDAVFNVVNTINAENIKSDLQGAVDVAKVLFGDNTSDGLLPLIMDVVNNIENTEQLESASQALVSGLIGDFETIEEAEEKIDETPVYKLLSSFFDLSIIHTVFQNEDFAALYEIPLENFIPGLAETEVDWSFKFNANWTVTKMDFSKLVISVADVISVVNDVMDDIKSGEYITAITSLDEEQVKTVANVLDNITSNAAIGTFARIAIADSLDGFVETIDEMAEDFNGVIDTLVEYQTNMQAELDKVLAFIESNAGTLEDIRAELDTYIEQLEDYFGEGFDYTKYLGPLGEDIDELVTLIRNGDSTAEQLKNALTSISTTVSDSIDAVNRLTDLKTIVDEIRPNTEGTPLPEGFWEEELLNILDIVNLAKAFMDNSQVGA